MILLDVLISRLDTLGDEVVLLIVALSEQGAAAFIEFGRVEAIGGSVVVIFLAGNAQCIIFRGLYLVGIILSLRCVPVVPFGGVVDVVGEDVARVVAYVVRQAEDVVVGDGVPVGIEDVFAVGIGVGMALTLEGVELSVGHDVCTGSIFFTVNLTGDAVGVGLLYEQGFL